MNTSETLTGGVFCSHTLVAAAPCLLGQYFLAEQMPPLMCPFYVTGGLWYQKKVHLEPQTFYIETEPAQKIHTRGYRASRLKSGF